jgi:site-specific DNA-cytosine methylase
LQDYNKMMRGSGRMKMLDLFSGLKGASQAFEAAGWEVITVDNNPDLNPTICCDIEDLWLHPDFQQYMTKEYFNLIWASPPCIEFYKVGAPWFDEYGNESFLASRTQVKCKCGKSFGKFRNSINGSTTKNPS